MRPVLPILALLVSLAAPVGAGEKLIDGRIWFRGGVDGAAFKGPEFDLVAGAKTFAIKVKKTGGEFVFPRQKQKLSDAVLSRNQQAAAVLLRGLPAPSRRATIATIDAAGKSRIYDYKSYEMTKELGWIVELGAVSDDGKLVLAKCAFMLPAEADGSERVNHRWVILEVAEGSLKVVESQGAIERWSGVAAAKGTASER